MTKDDLEFLTYFAQAHREALNQRESYIVDLRYGLTGSNPASYALISIELGVSRERIRQLLNKAHRKILSTGQRNLNTGKLNTPCAELLLYLRSAIRPREKDSVDRLIEFAQISLSHIPLETHALPLLVYLTYPDAQIRKENSEKAKKICQKFEDTRKKEKLSCKCSNLLSYTIYPQKIKVTNDNYLLQFFSRQRKVSLDGKGYAGSFYSHKLRRLVQYESNLEMSFLLCLDGLDEVVIYQEQPIKIEYEFEGDRFLYYPDILLVLKNGKAIVVEIKPVFKMGLKRNLNKWTALKLYCHQHGFGLLVTDGRYTIQQIQKHKVKLNFANAVLNKLQQGSIGWSEYREIKEQFCPSRNDFIALVLNNKLVWKLNPFYLSF